MNQCNETHRQIEDIIDAKKQSGQYDALCNSLKFIGQNTRYAYSTPACHVDDIRDTLGVYNIEGDNNNERLRDLNTVGPTDSEITLVRVKREGSHFRKQINWDNRDKIPGDGTHLGDSPSLVNLATLVVPSKQCDKSHKKLSQQEYLVPLSSWELDDTQENATTNLDEGKDTEQDTQSNNIQKEKSSTSVVKNLLKCIVFWKK